MLSLEEYKGKPGHSNHACLYFPMSVFLNGSESSFAIWFRFLFPTLHTTPGSACVLEPQRQAQLEDFSEKPRSLGKLVDMYGWGKIMFASPLRCIWIPTPATQDLLHKNMDYFITVP